MLTTRETRRAHRVLIVSNRLPVSVHLGEEGIELQQSSGGLATGLRPWHEGSNGLWVGWPGDISRLAADERQSLDRQLTERGIVPVHLSREHIDRAYHGFSNRVLWPLFHYQIDRVPPDAAGWDAYKAVNEAFADIVALEHRPGDTIWVHDYQLMLLPAMLRERLPDARIGFFLHIPFPSSEVFRTLPWRRDVLRGLLGADLIGFHTFAYMRHFVASLLHVDGLEADIDRVRYEGRDVSLGVFPMGIDAARFDSIARDPAVQPDIEAIRRDAGGRRIVLGIDRLDYTKGIPRRLQAVERLFEMAPDLRDRIRYIQVAVPSRDGVDQYQKFRRQVEEAVGRINGACGTLRSTPVHYIHQSVSMRELVALYCAADVMLVTPLRDGMNLVAKEFVASRTDDNGVLILSEFAGAAAELDGGVVVNPYDVSGVADAIQRALQMPDTERRARMQRLRRRVMVHDVYAWVSDFLDRLELQREAEAPHPLTMTELGIGTAIANAKRMTGCHLLLDYDGTLVPLARSPDLARPDAEVLQLLEGLAATPGVSLEIVSGRGRENLEEWLGHLPIGLWAEHGFWRRRIGEDWQSSAVVATDWMDRIRPILEQFTVSTPGSQIETKSASMAWHYRGAEREFGARQAHELRMLLGDALSNQPLEVLEGRKVIEIHLRGVSKAVVAHRAQAELSPDVALIAIGDDRTDERLFRALRAPCITIAVGRPSSCARFHLADYRAVRHLLRGLVSDKEPHATATPRMDEQGPADRTEVV